MSDKAQPTPGPYSAQFGAVHHKDYTGFLFTVPTRGMAVDVADALNKALLLPDMLAALLSAERQLAAAYGPNPDQPGSMGSKEGLAALRSVRAAIAKATGT